MPMGKQCLPICRLSPSLVTFVSLIMYNQEFVLLWNFVLHSIEPVGLTFQAPKMGIADYRVAKIINFQ